MQVNSSHKMRIVHRLDGARIRVCKICFASPTNVDDQETLIHPCIPWDFEENDDPDNSN